MNFDDYNSLPQRKINPKRVSKFKDLQNSFSSLVSNNFSLQKQEDTNIESDQIIKENEQEENETRKRGNEFACLQHRVPKQLSIIQQNIEARKRRKIAETTLSSCEGSKGENFECKKYRESIKECSFSCSFSIYFYRFSFIFDFFLSLSLSKTWIIQQTSSAIPGETLCLKLFQLWLSACSTTW